MNKGRESYLAYKKVPRQPEESPAVPLKLSKRIAKISSIWSRHWTKIITTYVQQELTMAVDLGCVERASGGEAEGSFDAHRET